MDPQRVDVLKRISEAAGDLSEGQRLVAEYLITNSERAVFLTAARLGQEVGVSESTVVRCAMALGYSGYPEMHRDLQEMVKSRLTTVDRLKAASDQAGSGEHVIERVMRADIEYIETTLREVSREDFKRAVEAISEARRILVIGLRSASAMAFFLGYSLNWILRNVTMISHGAGDMFEQVMCAAEGDVAIGITFPRYTRQAVELVGLAKKRGATTIGITDNVMSPLAGVSEILLTAKSGMPSYIDSFVGPLSLINALITAVGAEDETRTAAALGELEPVWDEYQIYFTDRTRRA
ncbi:MAG: MurR/RpiR family transcriptional regulator [Firmicutes bacterium]|nr:MurR/RpiR family transcriptional regulator [Bacillota bacterium]